MFRSSNKKRFKSYSKKLRNLKKGKKYQVKARGYVTVDGEKHYGAWSPVRKSKQIK